MPLRVSFLNGEASFPGPRTLEVIAQLNNQKFAGSFTTLF
jgi:hypothetical protein